MASEVFKVVAVVRKRLKKIATAYYIRNREKKNIIYSHKVIYKKRNWAVRVLNKFLIQCLTVSK